MEWSKQHEVIHRVCQADQGVKRLIERLVAGTGVYRSQHQLLMMLGKGRDCSQSELARRLDISPAAVAVSLNKLEKGGYIARQSPEKDGRVNYIVITEKGKDVIDSSRQMFREMDTGICKEFSEEELLELCRLLEKLGEGIRTYQSERQEGEHRK